MTFYCIVLQRVVLHAQTMAKSGVMLCTGAGLCYWKVRKFVTQKMEKVEQIMMKFVMRYMKKGLWENWENN